MEKRLIFAVIASSIVLVVWQFLTPKPVQIATKPQELAISKSGAAKTGASINQVGAIDQKLPGNLITFDAGNYNVVFNENEASIKEVIFKKYQSYNFLLHNGLSIYNKVIFKKDKVTSDSIVFVGQDREKQIIKRFTFSDTNYSGAIEIEIKNLSNSRLLLKPKLILGTLDFSDPKTLPQNHDYSAYSNEKLIHPKTNKDQDYNQLDFIGLRDRYFCAILAGEKIEYDGFVKKLDPKISEIGLEVSNFELMPGEKTIKNFSIYLGPQDLKEINAVNLQWAGIINYGTFDIIAQMLLKLLEIFYNVVHNWGLAIILLSLAVYLLLYPLTLKQMRSMKEMQLLQPKIQQLQKLHKDNPQKLNKEIMELYKEHKVNPLSGCLPLLLQMPIFFALYQALMRTVALKGASFLWIKDLSEPDRLIVLKNSIPLLGKDINLLPVLMMIGMFVQQKITMVNSGTAESNEQQKIMLIVFPLIFGIIFYNMPSGLVLYWFVNSMLMLVAQIRTKVSK